MLPGDGGGELVPAGVEQLAEPEEQAGPSVSDDEPHSRAASTADATTASTSAGEARATSAVRTPRAGS